ncbi:MAG TPA: cytochrome c oxidase subunit 3 [Terriglobales bacterium]|nr:cytochrome c oxidase subunit 3 [Terriglobales bacterium]
MGTLKQSTGTRGTGRSTDTPNGGDDGRYRPGRHEPAGYYERLRRYRLAVGVLLLSVIMIFVALTSAYIVREGMGTFDPTTHSYVYDWKPIPLPNALLLLNTAVLLLSSVTLEMARRNLNARAVTAGLTGLPGVAVDPERSAPWLGITLVLGIGFLAGQYMAWRELRQQGLFLATNPSSSFFYVLTGVHAAHLVGGVVALLYAAFAVTLGRSLATRRVVVDAASWYWHFMAVLWIYIFALLHFGR